MAQVTFAADTTPSLTDLDANFTELYSKTAYATAGIGYATGAGGTVTQSTSKSTGVTINKTCGQITTHNASLASGAAVAFVVTNSLVNQTDLVIVNIKGGFASNATYRAWVESNSNGAFTIVLENRSGGSLSEAVVLNFAIVKGVTS